MSRVELRLQRRPGRRHRTGGKGDLDPTTFRAAGDAPKFGALQFAGAGAKREGDEFVAEASLSEHATPASASDA
eukprot:4421638-Pleurochrysis_carterae.AAC.2